MKSKYKSTAKIAGIKLCEALREQKGFDAIALMPTNLYGFGDNYNINNSHVVAAMIRRFIVAKKEDAKSVVCWGTGKPLREILNVDDLANGINNIVSNDVTNEIFNLTTGNSKTIYEFASIIKSIKKNVIIESNAGEVEFMEGLKRPKRGTLNISKAREILNFKPVYDLEKGVQEYLDFMEENCKK